MISVHLSVLFVVLSNFPAWAVYVTQGQVFCEALCDPNGKGEQCLTGCLCFPRLDKPNLGKCFNPNAPYPQNFRDPRQPLPPSTNPWDRPLPSLPPSSGLRPLPRIPEPNGARRRPHPPGPASIGPLPQVPRSAGERPGDHLSRTPGTPLSMRNRPLPPIPVSPARRPLPPTPQRLG
uniref:Putative vegetative cell wall protein gp1 n=1 Tax=Amblyomma triste TaxID=251400 RepID=A0A023G1E7_AMBTT